MPFSQAEIDQAGVSALNFNLRNKPIDQVAVERPLLRKLMAMAKEFPGAKEYITERLRYQYGSNFQWYYGSQAVTYNFRNTLKESQFPWRGWHDGFYLDEDTLLKNGITYTDNGRGGQATKAEAVQLTDLLEEDITSLRLGAEESFDYDLHLDGTQSTEALEGIDTLIATDPTSGTVGGIDAASNTWWRNNYSLNISTANLPTTVESVHRACTRNGGQPDFYIAGETFIDAYREKQRADGTVQLAPQGGEKYDLTVASNTQELDSGIRIKGVPVMWDPVFATLDANLSPAIPWQKRCYMINCKHLRLRPARGHNMITRNPPRVYNRYVHYWGLTWKGALVTNKRIAHAVISIA